MGIYNRDNINYGGMLGNAMAQRANIIQREYDNYMKQPNAWAEATRNSGKIVQDAAMQYATHSMNMDKLKAQQDFQAEQAAKQQEFQKAENALSRDNALKIAKMSNQNAAATRESDARARLEKLYIQKSTLQAAGQDTRDIDVSIAQIMRDYPGIGAQVQADLAKQPPYDPTTDVRYQLAKYKNLNAKSNTGDLFQAYNALQSYKTPEAVERLAELDKYIEDAMVQDELNKQLGTEIGKFNGGLSAKLANNGYSVEYAGSVINLVDKYGRIVKQVPRANKSSKPSTPSNNWN